MNHHTLRHALCVLLLALGWPALAQQQPAPAPTGQQLFEPIASVLQGPRCINCHMVQAPHQKDIMITHAQQVVRGKDGHGAATLQCAACHQVRNTADGKVPGAPNWHLAPISMAWEGLTKAKLCQSIKDPGKNGGRKTMDEVIEHMKTDPLVLWAWNPGAGRSTPVLPHDAFVQKLQAWAAAGGPCPGDPLPAAIPATAKAQ
ncbi:hypothetical protein [Janthinobacterium agaricidamnosum]|uniref:Cytochrome c-type protein n=1 Tax=Janthinobacterium agaricidamnosum NBRC 102515 = DSM 9628 TaxID=1349767 RepID=W0V014_9BURK|nr:hypothetical protein [Janthinobacterium agaricidamnosum]CDG82169.1 cytochrome c-type protein [Janthinobacterium agaricidamnosum NBRC 102515 = DSM 9628]